MLIKNDGNLYICSEELRKMSEMLKLLKPLDEKCGQNISQVQVTKFSTFRVNNVKISSCLEEKSFLTLGIPPPILVFLL